MPPMQIDDGSPSNVTTVPNSKLSLPPIVAKDVEAVARKLRAERTQEAARAAKGMVARPDAVDDAVEGQGRGGEAGRRSSGDGDPEGESGGEDGGDGGPRVARIPPPIDL